MTFFSFDRFVILLSSNCAEHKRFFLQFFSGSFIISVCICIFIYLFDSYEFTSLRSQLELYLSALYVIGILFTYLYVIRLVSGNNKYVYLMIPATSFEKILSIIIIITLFFLFTFTILFYFIHIPLVITNNFIVDYNSAHSITNFFISTSEHKDYIMFPAILKKELFSYNSSDLKDYIFVFYAFFILQSFLVAGMIFFERFALIKTILTGFATVGLLVLIIIFMIATNRENYLLAINNVFEYKLFLKQNTVFKISGFLLKHLFSWLLLIIFWVIAYFNLKDKEIA